MQLGRLGTDGDIYWLTPSTLSNKRMQARAVFECVNDGRLHKSLSVSNL